MSSTTAPLVLASASPRRREILQRLHIPFRVEPSGVDESKYRTDDSQSYVLEAAAAKATDVMSRLSANSAQSFVLGADTVVTLDDCMLGKPADDREARFMLRTLSGRGHEVTTGVVLGRVREGVLGTLVVTSRVWFRALDDAEIDRYVQSGEGRDKAGSYAIQGQGRALAGRVVGSFTNVVGLPTMETVQLLARHDVLRSWP